MQSAGTGQTIVEKIFAAHVGHPVRAGEIVVSPVDFVYAHDANRPHPLHVFKDLGGQRVFDPARVAIFLDHAPNVHTLAVSDMHNQIRRFAEEQGLLLYSNGRGISHRLIPEAGHAIPGRIIVGSDSHTVTAGAFNLLSTGVGAADLAAAMMLGRLWFKVPQTIQIRCSGELPKGVYPKDLILHVVGRLGPDGANYAAVEFVGPTIAALSMGQRMTLTNMSIEMGAKFGIMEADHKTIEFLGARGIERPTTYVTDADADIMATFEVDASSLTPQVALPSQPDYVRPVGALAGTKISHATIGTCTNGDIEDIREAVRVLGDHHIAPGVRLFVAPATREVYLAAIREGLVEKLLEAGAVWGTSGCSGCTGSSGFGVPDSGENQITSAPRNFLGRTGNRDASIFLASPATVMASAIEGVIADPTAYLVS